MKLTNLLQREQEPRFHLGITTARVFTLSSAPGWSFFGNGNGFNVYLVLDSGCGWLRELHPRILIAHVT
jgi:hypothetical protein